MSDKHQKLAEKFLDEMLGDDGQWNGYYSSQRTILMVLLEQVAREAYEECAKIAYKIAFDVYDNDPTSAGIAARIDSAIRAKKEEI